MNERAIETADGAGGIRSIELVENLIKSKVPQWLWTALNGGGLDFLDDGAFISVGGGYIVLTSDTYTVKPIFFPGGDIGHLAASGVINDLVVSGARPIAFMDNIVVEEGFPLEDLEKIVSSMVRILVENNISLIGGDFKVMPKGAVDKIVISGFGIGYTTKRPIVDKVKPGDYIVVSNYLAEHGSTILAAQLGMLDSAVGLRSDSKPLTNLLHVIEKYRDWINAARDPTRGGLTGTIYEWLRGTGLAAEIDLSSIPLREEVRGFLEMLGVDPLTVASEGVAVFSVDSSVVDDFVKDLERAGEKPAIVGRIFEPDHPSMREKVLGKTEIGGLTVISPRVLNLPRIC